MKYLVDQLGRPLKSLRVSVTDRCDLRCNYCMPETSYTWLPRDNILRFEEIDRLVGLFTQLGVTHIRLTGGEPLLRRDLPELITQLTDQRALEDVALTTNGTRLRQHAASLKRAGLNRITISLDTLNPERFRSMTSRDTLADVLAGIEASLDTGLDDIKMNMVVIRNTNDDELVDMIRFCSERGIELRFIEYMDVGGATRWQTNEVISLPEILQRLQTHFGEISPLSTPVSSTAQRYALPDGSPFGIIASTTQPFCRGCNRSRLTADGVFFTCLYATQGTDLRQMLRRGDSDEALLETLHNLWHNRSDRSAELRAAQHVRGPAFERGQLIGNPHLEMHTRGG